MYKFTLRDNLGVASFGAEMVKNWDAIKVALTRNDNYRGLARKFTGSFDFVGEMRRRIISIADKFGSEAEIYLTVEIGDENKWRKSFNRVGGGELKADMTSLDITELEAKLNFVASGFEEKIFNRHDNDVQYNLTTSLDGDAIPVFARETMPIDMPDRVLQLNSALTLEAEQATPGVFYFLVSSDIIQDYLEAVKFLHLPFNIKYRSDDDFKNTISILTDDIKPADSFFILQASEAKTITIDYSINTVLRTECKNTNDGSHKYTFRKLIVDSNYNTKSDTIISQLTVDGNGLGNIPIAYNAIVDEVLDAGDSISFYIELRIRSRQKLLQPHVCSLRFLSFDASTTELAMYSESESFFPATSTEVILPHELFSRFLSIYTGEPLPFYSTIFGRVELGYPVDGEWAYLATLNGLMIRGFPFDLAKFATNLKNAFKAYNAILNLGVTIETMPDGSRRFRIDKYDDLFNADVVVSLSALVSGLSRKFDNKNIYSEILAGYNDEEYESLNGLGTFNGQFNFSTGNKSSANKLDIICPWITADYSIEKLRRLQYIDSPNTDNKDDDKIFIIDCIRIGDRLKPVQNEGFTLVEGILNPSTAINLNLSPGRNLRRWGSVIRASMPNGGIIRFGKGAKNTALITKKTGEAAPIIENADIDVNDLAESKYLSQLINISEAPFTPEQWAAIEQNPNGLVSFENKGIKLYLYIEDLQFNTARRTATINGIRGKM